MPDTYDNILLDRIGTDGRVGRITLNRPEKMNAITNEMMEEINAALHKWEEDRTVRVILFRGAGRAFSSGYDLTPGYAGRGTNTEPQRRTRSVDEKGRPLVMGGRMALQHTVDKQMYMWNMHKVTIAQLHGYALAGAMEFAMFCDLLTASENLQIGHVGVRGLGVPRNGAILPLVIGMRKAKELYFTGHSLTGKEAERLGMVNYAWPAEELEERTIAWADMIANMSADHLAILKTAMNRFYENMGIYSSVRSQTDLSAMGGQTEQAYAFWDVLSDAQGKGGGLRDALDWRDTPYRRYREITKQE